MRKKKTKRKEEKKEQERKPKKHFRRLFQRVTSQMRQSRGLKRHESSLSHFERIECFKAANDKKTKSEK